MAKLHRANVELSANRTNWIALRAGLERMLRDLGIELSIARRMLGEPEPAPPKPKRARKRKGV